MLTKANLYLLRDTLAQLTETAYFSSNLEKYASGLIEVVNYVDANQAQFPEEVLRKFVQIVWMATKYLSGSTTKEIPYELEYSLRAAIREWLPRECVITTALRDDQDFHFLPLDTWSTITRLTGFQHEFDAILIQIALPKLYKHKPLFSIPLYHELGHFVDRLYGVTNTTFLISPADASDGASPADQQTRHRQEFFADLFAACYVGHANYKLLREFAGLHQASPTHPAVADRVAIAQDFLNLRPNSMVDLFQDALKARGAPPLSIRYTPPDVSEAFGDIRPISLSNHKELHGIFEAGWDFLEHALQRSASPWDRFPPYEIERIINDLTEKSIRNLSVVEKWRNAIAQ